MSSKYNCQTNFRHCKQAKLIRVQCIVAYTLRILVPFSNQVKKIIKLYSFLFILNNVGKKVHTIVNVPHHIYNDEMSVPLNLKPKKLKHSGKELSHLLVKLLKINFLSIYCLLSYYGSSYIIISIKA